MTGRVLAAGVEQLDAMLTVMGGAFDPQFGEAWSGAQLTGTLAQAGSWARLAYDDDLVVGFSLCRRVVDEAELLLIAVVEPARGRGFGAKLLETALADARIRGAASMFLEMRDGNRSAAELYLRRGFVEIGRRRDYYRGLDASRFDAITMRCDLSHRHEA